MATNWVDEVKSGATSTGSKALSLATGSALSVSNTTSENLFTVTADASNGGYTSILGIEGQESILFLGADNADDAADVWQIQADTSGNLKIGNRTSGTGAPTRSNTITDVLTIDSSRNISVGVDDTGYDVKFFGATSGQYLLWDESADELVLAGDSKLSFHDAAGGENIIATSDGHLEINAGTTLDITAPTVDLNGTLDVSSTSTLTGLVTASAGVKLGNNIIYASDGGTAITLDTDDNVAITGDLTVNGNDINFGNGGKITDSNGSFVFQDTDGAAGFVLAIDTQNAGQDSSIGFKENGTTKWLIGNDGSDSDKLKIASSSAALHTNTELTLDDSGNMTLAGNLELTGGTLTVGADDTGYDVKFFGATAGSYMLWDESADCLSLTDSTNLKIGDGFDLQLYHDGADSYIANSTGALKVATTQSGIAVSIGHTTSETTVNDNLTVLGDTTVKGSLVFRAQPVTDTTNGAVTYSAANVLQGFLLRNPNGSDRSDIFPTAAQIVAAIPNCAVGSSFRLHIRNTADADETITMTAPDSSVVLSGTMTISQNNAREFLCQVTNVTGSSESINIFSLGTYVY